MPVRQVEGAALLVAGHGAPGTSALDASAVHTLGQIGEALLATGSPWHIRRLTATGGDRYAADRKTIKRSLTDLINDPVRVAVLVLLGEIVELSGELCLVTGADAHEYPEDATLPLSWIRERLASTKAEHLVVAISACGDGDPTRWLHALGTEGRHHIVAVDSPHDGNPMVDALLAGLCGEALDPQTGTVTMASLSKHLLRHAKCVQTSMAEDTVAQPPPLAGLWDVRHSQLANRPRPRHSPDEPEDLTGTVLPGRFRIDRLVARGTFGTVYRARQLAVERDVAIKVLHADIDPSSEDGRLFVNEIRNVGRIDHANVVRIHQADITHDGRLFFAMELLDGQDLQQLGTARLERCRAIELVRQLLAGLGAAHDAGLVHADIKPANAIVVPPRGESESSDELRSTTRERAVLVDFGLARLRPASGAAQSAGGTPMFMAPEQVLSGRVDARSDLFSVGLVLLWLFTGWRRPNIATMAPTAAELEKLISDDPHLRQVIARALDTDPAKRFQKAREFSAALAGPDAKDVAREPAKVSQETPKLPFRSFAPLTEADRGRLQGRDSDVTVITEHALYRRCVIYAAPSGTGKTSTLRAGLLPRLEALGIHAVYIPCRTDFAWSVVKAIAPGAPSIADAITQFHEHRGGKLVIVVDQLETALSDPEFISQLLAYDRWPRNADVSIVLAVREDYLARLLARTQPIEPNLPIVRLPPLPLAGARAAIVTPLTESRLSIEPELLDVLLDDLRRAADAIGPEMGWGSGPAVFPPHLQLVCSVLHESMSLEDKTLTLEHYRRLGGFEAIVGEHLDRVIETELDDGRDLIARDLFLALVTAAHQRAIRPESELFSIVGAKHGIERVKSVLEVLRDRGLVLRVRGETEPSWELAHDSLVERVLAWVDRKDLARRRAIEVVRYHLRRSTKDAPSLLTRKELRELSRHEGAVEELDDEWSKRATPDIGWTPSRLVARSRQVFIRGTATFSSILVAALLVGGGGLYRSRVEAAKSREQASLRERDLGAFTLRITAFDWDPVEHRGTPAAHEVAGWMLHTPDPKDPRQPGEPFAEHLLVRGTRRADAMELVEDVEAHGGAAFLVVARRGCSASIVPIARLPGYAQREQTHELDIRVPTCRATRAGMVAIPAGPFVFGGVGDPAATIYEKYPEFAKERIVTLPDFEIDRTEVPNSQFKVFASMASITGIEMPKYTNTPNLGDHKHARVPVTGVDFWEARAFCQFLGKHLPSTQQWTKALRGGEQIDGAANPAPRRNLPWIGVEVDWLASEGITQVGSRPRDTSPYGVLDLAGNVTEWTRSVDEGGARIIRGGNWEETTKLEVLVNFVALDNPREDSHRRYSVGFRCASVVD